MAAPFYSRYVPPTSIPSTTPKSQSLKRKKSSDDATTAPPTAPPTPKKSTKAVKSSLSDNTSSSKDRLEKNSASKTKKKKSRDAPNTENVQTAPSPRVSRSTPVPDTSSAYPPSKTSEKARGTDGAHRGDGESSPAVNRQTAEDHTPVETKPKSRESKRKRKNEDDIAALETAPATKHAKILSKYEKYTIKAPKASDVENPTPDQIPSGQVEEETPAHGLTPLPQPAPAPESSELPSYSTLPAWLTHPFTVSPDDRRSFADLGLTAKQITILETRGYSSAMPIQSAVIPLALSGKEQHKGDICISAATGSGKTLSYVLPLVSTIQSSPISQLRGLIIVPTRELVKQARETCELCATGTGLRIGTAVGSTALKDEQSLLMQLDQVYDPEAWDRKSKPVMTSNEWANFNLQEYIAEAKECHSTLPNHVLRTSPNVDILVCTPGRLVDHIRSTKGFTLEHLQWLVIDEADRLLNESFQEWTDIVIPAIELSRKSDSKVNALLGRLGDSSERRTLRKMILSATMTRDITKLNSLRLHNPKLVEVRTNNNREEGTSPQETAASGVEIYRLPPTLTETFLPVKDVSTKPLYLLQLMVSHLHIGGPESQTASKKAAEDSDASSSSETEEDSSESDSESTTSTESTPSSSSGLPKSSSGPVSSSSRSALIFTRSSESASRLARLLALLKPSVADQIGVLVKSNKSSTARKTLAAYRQGKVRIIIATDRASRGLDLPSLDHVISYDIPMSLTSYIHRVGRTARAGRQGAAWTLVAHNEGRWFSNEIVKSTLDRGDRPVKRMTLKLDDDSDLQERYASALKQLEKEVVASQKKSKQDKPVKS